MKGSPKPRRTSRRVATSPGCQPLKEAYAEATTRDPRIWDEIDDVFLRAMEGFDRNVVAGEANQGDIQNGKGDFLNDLLALLLENCAETSLVSRGSVPGLIFPNHNLDVTYPATGIIQFLLEAKAVGIPRHPRNPQQRNPLGRPGSADLPKRIKEAAFKTIDLKAEYGRIMAMQGNAPTVGPGGNLTTWLRNNKPTSYLFITARVVDRRDSQVAQTLARAAAQVMDVVGLYLFEPLSTDEPTNYRPVPVERDIEMSATLYRACQDISSIQPQELEERAGPAEEAMNLLDEKEQSTDENSSE